MFTGIIHDIGVVQRLRRSQGNCELVISTTRLISEIHAGDSVAVSGVCLTVSDVAPRKGQFAATAVSETLKRSSLGILRCHDRVNLELALKPGDRFGGHFVQGHVDAVGKCITLQRSGGSWLARFAYPAAFSHLVVEKGSIAVDGVSLTACQVEETRFSVSIIPHTWEATTLALLKPGTPVNLEFDMIAKHVYQITKSEQGSGITKKKLIGHGF